MLEALGYLAEGGQPVTDAGRMLARIYCELDLVAAECVRAGLFDELTAPELAAVVVHPDLRVAGRRPAASGADAQPRRPRSRSRWSGRSGARSSCWSATTASTRDATPTSASPSRCSSGRPASRWPTCWLHSGLTAGDFVRWTRMVIDLLGQFADAAGPGPLRRTCREAIVRMRRGVVDAAYDEDD